MSETLSYHDYFKKDLRVILLVTVVLSILGNASDIFVISGRSQYVAIINSINIVINVLTLFLHYSNRINVKSALAISIYAIFMNFIVSQAIDFPNDNSLLFFLRATLFIALVVTLSAICIGKIHSVLITLLFFTFYIAMTISTKNMYLRDNLIMIFIVFVAYNVTTYYFVNNIQKAIKKLQMQNQIITQQKDSLQEAYWEQEKTYQILQKQNDELVIAKNKAEESDSLKTAFLANMSHEIRTPMNGILGFATLLKKPSLSDEKQKKYIVAIEQSGKRMLNIINDIIDISKIEAGQAEANFEPANINLLIDELKLFFNPEIAQKELLFKSKKAKPDSEVTIETDRNKLAQVLTNLIKNAIKFTEKGEINFGYEIKVDMLVFFVSDTGMGINPEFHNVVFERFRQADTSHARQYEGAGLGLSISKAFVELLGGKIWIESNAGKGSTFYFTLPYKKIETESNTKSLENFANIKITDNKTIVIAEDDELSYIFISELLENSGINLIRAKNGSQAIELLKRMDRVDLILMDIKMPEVDGYQASDAIKKINPGVPIIAQTAYALEDEKNKGLLAGFDDYISKPIQQEQLNAVLSKYLHLKS